MAKDASSAADFLPADQNLTSLKDAAVNCRGCDLWREATQTVFGEGLAKARMIMVGEQPGDKEDLAGKPFVGPAGRLLDRALDEAGIARQEVYVTNAVKHFKWQARGKLRIHKKPGAREIAACRPWLAAEIGAVKPRVIVAMGSTAAQSIFGRDFKLTQHRGEFIDSPLAPCVIATVHPSAILRAPDEESRHDAMKRFIGELRIAASALRDKTGQAQ
ncbi:MAG: UdgX family uracil-DNA binding protein [Candidatus Binataceae bacterium]